MLSLIAGGGGLLIAFGVVELLRTMTPFDVPRLAEAQLNGPVAALGLGLAVLAGLVAGLLPGLRVARRVDVTAVLNEGGAQARGGGGGQRLHRGLLVTYPSATTAPLATAFASATFPLAFPTATSVARLQPFQHVFLRDPTGLDRARDLRLILEHLLVLRLEIVLLLGLLLPRLHAGDDLLLGQRPFLDLGRDLRVAFEVLLVLRVPVDLLLLLLLLLLLRCSTCSLWKCSRFGSIATIFGNGLSRLSRNARSVSLVSSVIATTSMSRSLANASTSGIAALQGPHQVAQKSRRRSRPRVSRGAPGK